MLSRVRTFLALDAASRRLFLRAWWLLLCAEIGLRTTSLERCERRLLAREEGALQAATALPPQEIARWVQAAARHHLLPMTCLRRALVLKTLLVARGTAAELVLGVRREGAELLAHAWVEVEGMPVGEPAAVLASYRTLEAAPCRA